MYLLNARYAEYMSVNVMQATNQKRKKLEEAVEPEDKNVKMVPKVVVLA